MKPERGNDAGSGSAGARIATLLRTLWYLRGEQLAGQARRALVGREAKPRAVAGEPPRPALAAPHTAWLASPPHAQCESAARIALISRTLASGGAGAIDW